MHNLTGKAVVPLGTYGGLVTYAGPDSLPSGVSPRCHDVDFSVGSVASRGGTRNRYQFAFFIVTNPGTLAASASWANPSNAYSTSSYASASGLDSGAIDVTQFAFNVTSPVTGIVVRMNGNCNTSATYSVQLLQGGVPVGTAKTASPGVIVLGGGSDLWNCAPNVNDTTFGVRIEATSAFPLAAYTLNSVSITVYLAGGGNNFQYIKSFPASNGTLKTLAMDSAGEMWVEDVTNAPGTLAPLFSGVPANSYAKSTTADDREYIAFSDLATGCDIPRQYTGDWIDRITQVGPGAPPTFTPQTYTGNTFGITSITQPAGEGGFGPRTSSYFLQSAGVGSTAAGNTVTIYYSDSTVGGGGKDTDLETAFNSGFPVYIYASFTGGPVTQGPYVVQVTSIGLASPPGQPRPFYYFTYTVPTVAATYYQGSGHPGYTANYQRTLATLTTAVPVPGLLVGNQTTIAGTTVTNYNTTWTISQDINSGSFVITQSGVSAGVATFSYALSSGVAPVAGQQVTITGTTNANSALNAANVMIAGASGGSSGTFTVNVSLPNATTAAESGQGTTAGTIFAFDPGQPVLGSSTNPIYGNATGGNLIFAGTSQFISPGTRQGVVFFGTRDESETFPSIPVTFTIPTNTSTILSSQIPIGPPNVAYRQIAITEAGQLGLPGGNFYTIDDPVTYTVNGVTYTSNSFRINDNITTSVALTFRDSDLLAGRPIDQQGEDLFNQIEIGNPAWIAQYAGRLVYGLTQAKVQNFINLSFDGGYYPNTIRQPLGWTVVGAGGQLITSPTFGNSYYIQNTTGATASLGLITQSAFRDYYGVEIIRPNVAYSVRLAARIPSGRTTGSLAVTLTSGGVALGTYSLPFASMSTQLRTFSGTLWASMTTIPADLTLTVQGVAMGDGADVEIERMEPFPTRQPVNETRLLVSYEADPEGVDGDTGAINTASENTQPCFGAVVMYDLLYLLKSGSMYYTQDSSGDEPSKWGVHEVSNKAGACGVNAYDSGEEWILMANRNGVYLFTGGEPRKISQEVQQVWDAVNWSTGNSIWARNDVAARKLYVGVPLPTPNFWLPTAPVNAAPASPNVVLVCSYEGQGTGSEVADSGPIADTFYGDLIADDLHRKWTIWQLPSPYADFITQQNGSDAPLLFGNGISNSKIYSADATNDDGAEIPWLYTTYGFGNDKDVSKFPVLGSGRKRWNYMLARITGAGKAIATFYANKLDATTQYAVPINLDAGDEDRERPLNIPGYRVYAEFSSGGLDSTMDLSSISMVGAKDVYNSIRGVE